MYLRDGLNDIAHNNGFKYVKRFNAFHHTILVCTSIEKLLTALSRESYLHHLSYCVGQVEYDMQELKVMVRSMIGYLSTKMHLFKK